MVTHLGKVVVASQDGLRSPATRGYAHLIGTKIRRPRVKFFKNSITGEIAVRALARSSGVVAANAQKISIPLHHYVGYL